jgi:GNAT superfamily N-acetyltransferase
LAVDRRYAGRRLGEAMLKDALTRVVSASESIGIRAVLVHAKDEEARRFYERYDFVASPTRACAI